MGANKLLSKLTLAVFCIGLISPVINVKAEGAGEFKDPLKPAVRNEWKGDKNGQKFISKPLVILMDYKDYDHKDLDKKEKQRINKFKGKDCTPEFYQKFMFGDTYKEPTTGIEYTTPKKFYEEESGGSYILDGEVFGWYQAEHEASYYGVDRNNNDSAQDEAAELVREALECAANDPKIDLSKFDVEDKWDFDKDGNYYEPDGILDTVVVIHPGMGKEFFNGGSVGKEAIWPFQWELSQSEPGSTDANPIKHEFKDSKGKPWKAENFTVFEQDFPADLWCHEFGHSLGNPDLYAFGENVTPPVQLWSVYGGSYGGEISGSKANGFGAYCRDFMQRDYQKKNITMNWSRAKDIELKDLDEKGVDVTLDQSTLYGDNPDTVRINLPTKSTSVCKPTNGKNFYFSTKGNNLKTDMQTKEAIDLQGKGNGYLEFIACYDIDPGFDFATVQAKVQGTDKWVPLKGTITTSEVDPYLISRESKEEILKRNPGQGITNTSKGLWVYTRFDLKQFMGNKIDLKIDFRTDTNTPKLGIYVDYIKVFADKKLIFSDDAENESKFNLNGFIKTDGTEKGGHYYLLEWRQNKNSYVDQGMNHTPEWSDGGIKYDPGMLVWYVNERMKGDWDRPDQEADQHPGEVFAGIVDADQDPIMWKMKDGSKNGVDKPTFQMHDVAFSLREGQPVNKDWNNGAITVDNHTFMEPLFDDSKDYTNSVAAAGNSICNQVGLKLDNLGLKIFLVEESKNSSTARVHIAKENTKIKSVQDISCINNIEVKDDKISLKTDKKYAEKAYVCYVNEKGKKEEVILTLSDVGVYEGNLNASKASEGTWKISFVVLHDTEGNAKAFYNSNVHKVFGGDLSKGDFKSTK